MFLHPCEWEPITFLLEGALPQTNKTRALTHYYNSIAHDVHLEICMFVT